MSIFSIDGIFDQFRELKVLILGDSMVDSYTWGTMDRISPEAPVPVLHIRKREKRLGGAGNVARNIRSLGAQPFLLSVVGDDQAGSDVFHLLESEKMPTEGIILSQNRITTVKERYLAGSQHILRVDHEETTDLSPEVEKKLMKLITRYIPESNLVIIEDYDKGVLNKKIIRHILTKARISGLPVVVDPKRKNFFNYRGASLFKPNLKEINEGLNTAIAKDDLKNLEQAIRTLIKRMKLSGVMVTLSDHGLYLMEERKFWYVPAHKREISDVSGAGDTVVSLAGLCYALNLPNRFTAEICNLGGGLVCEHPGVVPIDKKALKKEAKLRRLDKFLI